MTRTMPPGDACACGHDGYDGHDMRTVPPACLNRDCPCGPCEHEDWDRTICDWVACTNPATKIVEDSAGYPMRVCDEDAVLYEMTNELLRERHTHDEEVNAFLGLAYGG